MELRKAFIVDGVRTPIGRAHPEKGWLREVRPDDLAIECVKALIARNRVEPSAIEDVILGCANQSGAQGINIARFVSLLAGLPETVSATTVDRQCASAMTAVHNAAQTIMCNNGEIIIAGGLESMSLVPMGTGADFNPKLVSMYNPADLPMGPTAEKVAELRGLSREEQDKFAYESHMKAVKAWEAGKFQDEVIPITVENGNEMKVIDRDQCPRKETSLEKLATLMPVFKPGGSVTAGNSSPLNDGAAALLLAGPEAVRRNAWRPIAAVTGMAVAGVDPTIMGMGPVPAVRKLLDRTGLSVDDIDLIEINEAFASQSLACIRELGLDPKKVNVNGGALALGHPLGCSGARIIVTLCHEMKRRGARYGLATMCVGFGMGAATLVERTV